MQSLLLALFVVANQHSVFSFDVDQRTLPAKGRHHGGPTYFRREYNNGTLIDRRGQDYGRDIKFPIISNAKVSLARVIIQPSVVDNGADVNIHWIGVEAPAKDDWIGFYCPISDDPKHYLDYFKVSSSPTWQKGFGSAVVRVYNMRTSCVFKYYRNDKYSQLVAMSNTLSFTNGPLEPLQGHISTTGDPEEMVVMWVSGSSGKTYVRYGTDASGLSNIEIASSKTYKATDMCGPPASTSGFWDPGYIHKAVLKGLKPHTTYYYSFGSDKIMSRVYNFTTALAAGDPTSYKFVAYGDMGLSAYPGGHETSVLMQEEVIKNGVRLILHDGDISYAEGMAYIWEQWFALIENYATLVPYMVSIGNHEQDHTTGGAKDPSGAPGEGFHPQWGNFGDDSGGECGVPMYHRFTMPANGNALWWYSFDFGLVHYIIMSTEHNFTTGSRQYNWLVKDLQSVNRKTTPWIVLLGHRPMYCSGYYPGDYEVTKYMRTYLEDVFYKYNVDVAIWGHYHSYERTCKVHKEICDEKGTLHLMIGSAGASLDSGKYYHEDWSVYREDTFGYGRFTVANATALYFEFVRNEDQKVTDSIWLLK